MKNVFRHPNVKKDRGYADYTVSLFVMVFIAVLAMYIVQVHAFMSVSQGLEDAIVDAALASAVPDLSEYGRSGSLSIYADIRDEESSRAAAGRLTHAWQMFITAFSAELELDGNMVPENREMYGERIIINDFRIYNLIGNTVYVWQRSGSGMVLINTGETGTLSAPDGTLITETSVYADISAVIDGRFAANKKKLVAVRDR